MIMAHRLQNAPEMTLNDLCAKLQESGIEALCVSEKAHGMHVVLSCDMMLSRISDRWLVSETVRCMPIGWPKDSKRMFDGPCNEMRFKDEQAFFELEHLDFVLKCIKRIIDKTL